MTAVSLERVRRPTGQLRWLLHGAGRYGWGRILLGLAYRRQFTSLRALLICGGRPFPAVSNQGQLLADVFALWSGARIEVLPGGTLSIGKGTFINRGTRIVCGDEMTIGADCMISWDVVIMDTDQHEIPGVRPSAPIAIGDRAIVGCRTIVMKGVTIGEGAVVGAGSIVTRDVPPYTIAAGQPARVLRPIETRRGGDPGAEPRLHAAPD